MYAVCFKLCVQSVRRDKKRVLTADFLCFFIHFPGKGKHCLPAFFLCVQAAVHGKPSRLTPVILCNHHCCIVVGFQHQPVKEILHPVMLALLHAHMYLRLSRRVRRNRQDVLRISSFQCQNTCHDLRRARHRQDFVPVFGKQNTPVLRVHQDGGTGVQLIG